MAVRLSGSVLNSSCPKMMLPAVLFPDPDRPSRTSRSSGVDEAEEAAGEEREDGGEGEEVAKVGVGVEEEKIRDWEDETRATSEDSSPVLLNR